MPHERTITLVLALLLTIPVSLASTVAPPIPAVAPPGAGGLDPWVDAAGDTMFGELDMGANPLILNGNEISATTANTLLFNGVTVCVDLTGSCTRPVGPMGPQGPAGSIAAFNCGASQFLRQVNATGTATCAADQVGIYTAGTGLALAGSAFSADATYLQRRVSKDCGAGASIRSIAENGTPVCEADDSTNYTAGSGISIAGDVVSLASAGCAAFNIWKWTGSVWKCDADNDTKYGAGSGLALSGTTFTVPINGISSLMISNASIDGDDVNSGEIQLRVTGTCASSSYVTQVNANGSVACDSVLEVVPASCAEGALVSGIATNGTVVCVDVIQPETGTCAVGQSLVGHGTDGEQICTTDALVPTYSTARISATRQTGVAVQNVTAAIDRDGLPIAAYRNASGGLRFARCATAGCTSPDDVALTSGPVGSISLAQSANGESLIAYHALSNGNLHLIRCTTSNCSAKTTIQIDTPTADVGANVSVGISTGPASVMAAYYNVTSANLEYIACQAPDCNGGTKWKRTLESTGDVGRGISILNAASGAPAIFYTDVTNGALRAHFCSDHQCASTIPRTIDSNGGVEPVAVVDPDGRPVIAHREPSSGHLVLTRCESLTCISTAGYTRLAVHAGPTVAHTLTLDRFGVPIIAYERSGPQAQFQETMYIRCSFVVGCAPALDRSSGGGGALALVLGVDARPLLWTIDEWSDELTAHHLASERGFDREWRRG